jgi:hypothetical protein
MFINIFRTKKINNRRKNENLAWNYSFDLLLKAVPQVHLGYFVFDSNMSLRQIQQDQKTVDSLGYRRRWWNSRDAW